MQCKYIKRDQTQCPKIIKTLGQTMCADHRKAEAKKNEKKTKDVIIVEKETIEPIQIVEPIKEVKPEPKPESKIEVKTAPRALETKGPERPLKKLITFKNREHYEMAKQLIAEHII